MNQAVELNGPSLENALLMREWGKWARNAELDNLGFARPSWVAEVATKYPESSKDVDECLPDISDEYGLLVDRCLSGMQDYSRSLIVLYYERRLGLNNIARILKKSRQRVSTDRDCALSALYGMVLAESA